MYVSGAHRARRVDACPDTPSVCVCVCVCVCVSEPIYSSTMAGFFCPSSFFIQKLQLSFRGSYDQRERAGGQLVKCRASLRRCENASCDDDCERSREDI